MSRKLYNYSALLATSLLAMSLAGCGTDKKEGTATAELATAGADTKCIQCHSSVLDQLTGEGKMAQYVRSSPHKDSTHLGGLNGCEACHGGGAEHNGVGPIQFGNPYDGNGTRCASCHKGNYATNAPTKFADSLHGQMQIETGASCRRCHTHEGAVLGNVYGMTGTKAVLDSATVQGSVPLNKEFGVFQCSTCHEHGGGLRSIKARDSYTFFTAGTATVNTVGAPLPGNVVNWNPSKSNQINDQYNLCTSCHNLKTWDGNQVMASGSQASGTVQVGHHETSWYRVIATTHNDVTNEVAAGGAAGGITGYIIRIPKTAADAYANTTNPDAKPCFDCHAHEAKTGTNYSNPNNASYDATKSTIHTDWAKSGHAGKLLTAKVTAAGATANSTALVDTVMNAKTTAAAWAEPGHDWSATANQDCQRCHTATGASNYLNGPTAYVKTKNDFQHLAGWSTGTKASTQHELLYCWGCHSNAGAGVVRNPGAITAEYKVNGTFAQFPDVGNSNTCVACHEGRASSDDIAAITDFSNASFKNSHYMAAAGVMYMKLGFINFTSLDAVVGTSTYGKTLQPNSTGPGAVAGGVEGGVTSKHRRLGTPDVLGAETWITSSGIFDSGGPCVTCHMSATVTNMPVPSLGTNVSGTYDGTGPFYSGTTKLTARTDSHTLSATSTQAAKVCTACHGDEASLIATGVNGAELKLEEAKPYYDAARAVIAQLLVPLGIEYDSLVYPYFFKAGTDHSLSASAFKDWTRGRGNTAAGNAYGKKLMGACYNLNLLTRDPAAYVHGRSYSQRLLFDTIDFLDDGIINKSSAATLVAKDPTNFPNTTSDHWVFKAGGARK